MNHIFDSVKATFFDFDGIILDSEWPVFESWRKIYTREGKILEKHIYIQCIGSDFDTWSPENHLEELTGKSYDWEKENADRQDFIVKALENARPMPGAAELIKSLKDQPTAVVSSSSHRWVDGWLEKFHLAPYFNTTVCRGDARRIKPAPDLYLEAARRLNVEPKDCLVIEDSKNGMLAAQAAGMKVLAVPNRLTNIIDFSAADWKASSLNEVLDPFLRKPQQCAPTPSSEAHSQSH